MRPEPSLVERQMRDARDAKPLGAVIQYALVFLHVIQVVILGVVSHAIAHAQVDPHIRERLEAFAREGDRSLAAEIRRALRAHVERAQAIHNRERTEDTCSRGNSQTTN